MNAPANSQGAVSDSKMPRCGLQSAQLKLVIHRAKHVGLCQLVKLSFGQDP